MCTKISFAITVDVTEATLPLSVVGYGWGIWNRVDATKRQEILLPSTAQTDVTKCGLNYFQWFYGTGISETGTKT
jgi:hypothetical protein